MIFSPKKLRVHVHPVHPPSYGPVHCSNQTFEMDIKLHNIKEEDDVVAMGAQNKTDIQL